jgi:predicted MPP superfamily phosphohydrolase
VTIGIGVKATKRPAALAAVAGAAAGWLAYEAAWREPRRLVVRPEALRLPGWPAARDGYTVALVSDLHAGAGHMTPARVDAVVDAVIAARPDLVLLLGDYLDSTWLGRGRAGPEDVAGRLARLPNRVAVLGNHDWRAAGAAMWRALEAAGIPVLENAAREVAPGLWVAGTAEFRYRTPDVGAALAGVPEDAAVLLMIHDPDLFPWVPPRVALSVAGHLHGGQVNLPLIRRAMLPTRYGERYLAGHVVEGGRHLYVSAGLGTSGLPVRLRRPPEVPLLRLWRA